MTDFARQRRAHDIWVSRSQLNALGVGMVLFAIACFALGYTAGRRSVDRYEHTSNARLLDQPADDALVELLARVDAAATPDGGLRKLTFPDALAGEAPEIEVPKAEVQALKVEQSAGEASVLDAPSEAPPGRWTVALASLGSRDGAAAKMAELQTLGLNAWVGTERIDGRSAYRVALGGFGSRSEAEEAAEQLSPSLGVPSVVRY